MGREASARRSRRRTRPRKTGDTASVGQSSISRLTARLRISKRGICARRITCRIGDRSWSKGEDHAGERRIDSCRAVAPHEQRRAFFCGEASVLLHLHEVAVVAEPFHVLRRHRASSRTGLGGMPQQTHPQIQVTALWIEGLGQSDGAACPRRRGRPGARPRSRAGVSMAEAQDQVCVMFGRPVLRCGPQPSTQVLDVPLEVNLAAHPSSRARDGPTCRSTADAGGEGLRICRAPIRGADPTLVP